jgi:hypothetical protein
MTQFFTVPFGNSVLFFAYTRLVLIAEYGHEPCEGGLTKLG